MKIRIMGTESECADFVKMVRKTVPFSYIRTISGFYPNVRKCTYSNEGRVYIEIVKPDTIEKERTLQEGRE